MDRRDILKYTAWVTGAAISAPLAGSILTGCKGETPDKPVSGMSAFSSAEQKLLETLVDIILPKTDSPSATEVSVHHTIQSMVNDVYGPQEKERYLKGFKSLSDHLDTSKDIRQSLVALEESTHAQLGEAKRGYMSVKQQTIAYYLSTEEIGKNFLNYLPVPGEYKGCISLEEVDGKAWAL